MKKTLVYFLLSVFFGICAYLIPLNIPQQAHLVLAISVTIGMLWLTEVIPIYITSLLIPLSLAIFADFNVRDVFFPFFDPVVVLLMGGFALAYSLQKYGLDEIIANFFTMKIGTSPRRFLLGMMLATAFLSMWMSNSATSAVMIPIMLVVLKDTGLKPFKSSYAKAAVLGVAFAATIGGFGTIVGTTPNAMAVKFLADENITISFLDWMYYSIPFTIPFIFFAWFVLLLVYKPEIKELHVKKRKISLNKSQLKTLAIFSITVLLWLTSGLHKIPIALVALIPIVLFYTFKMFNRDDFGKFDWDILILVGGGLSLGSAIEASGLNVIIAEFMKNMIIGNPLFIILFLTSLFCIFMTLFSSNTGTAAFIIPAIIPLSTALGIDTRILVIIAGISVSLDFLVPIGTPPNAVAYSTGYIHIKDMIKIGIILALLGAFLLSFFAVLYW
ncbi:MAG: DASS family sodium-coupled anion symporter [Candidatus Aenigmarchaeota archaeon]|nr:DASS family sodium-coupled anion symporter [Candidatus Aenigmarchaeota archaeon]